MCRNYRHGVGGTASERPRRASAGAVARRLRAFVTPGLLVASMGTWVALWTSGVPSLATSLLASIVMVGGILLLERATPRPGLAPRPAGTLRADIAFTATTTLLAIAAPPFVVVPLGRVAGGALGSAALWPTQLPLWASAAAAVLIGDFTSYWWHRLQHTTGESWLWRLHSVHHSPR